MGRGNMADHERDKLRQKFRAKLEELAAPIDFESLIAEGVLVSEGSGYRVMDLRELPRNALDKMLTLEINDTKPGALVTFDSEDRYQKMLTKWGSSGQPH